MEPAAKGTNKRARPLAKEEKRKKAKYCGAGGGGPGGQQIAGTRGVLVSCPTGREVQCRREVISLFAAILSKHAPAPACIPAQEEPLAAAGSIADDLDAEIAELQKEKAATGKRAKDFAADGYDLSGCDTGVKGVVYVRVGEELPLGPVDLVRLVIESARPASAGAAGLALPSLRYAVRLVPLMRCCQAALADLSGIAGKIVPSAVTELKAKTYSVEYKARYNDNFSRMETIQAMARCVPPGLRADLKNPDAIIGVQVFQRHCGLCVVPGDFEFNYRQVIEHGDESAAAPAVGAPTAERGVELAGQSQQEGAAAQVNHEAGSDASCAKLPETSPAPVSVSPPSSCGIIPISNS